MPTYSYKGYQFQIDGEPTAEQWAGTMAHIDTLPPKEEKEDPMKKLLQGDNSPEKTGAALQGTGEALAGMASGLPSQLAGGLGGLSTLMATGDIDKAGNFARDTQEKNFGFGQFKPVTKGSADVTENITSGMEKVVKGAGELGFKVGGELGRTNAEIAAESLMNLVEPAAAVKGGMAAFKRKAPKLAEEVKAPSVAEVLAKAEEEAKKIDPEVAQDLAALKQAMDRERMTNALAPEKAAKEAQADVDQLNQVMGRERMDNKLALEDKAQKDQVAAIQAQLEELLAKQAKDERPNLTSLEDEHGQQSLFDQGDQMGQKNQFNADGHADWRIDENGMPVRVDKAMEAANLEAPLQRNLFGDELGPALDQGRSLTEAIDSTPANGMWAQRRSQINRLGGRGQELNALPELNAALLDANGPKLPFEPNTTFQPTNPMETARLGDIKEPPLPPTLPDGGGTPPRAPEGPSGGFPELTLAPLGEDLNPKKDFTPTAVDKQGNPIEIKRTVTNESISYKALDEKGNLLAQVFFEQNPDGSLGAGHVQSHAPGRGIAETMYRQAKDEGFTIRPGRAQTEQGVGLVKNLQEKGIIEPGPVTPIEHVARDFESQTGATAALEPLPPEQRPVPVDSITHPVSPEMIAKKEELARAAEHMPGDAAALDEYREIHTKEETKSKVLDNPKDIGRDFGQRNLSSGINLTAALSNSPVLKYARTILNDARRAADKFSRTFVTAKDGIAPMWSKMDAEQRVAVHEALREGDKRQRKITDAEMDTLGFTPEQKQYVKKFYEADDALWARYNGNLMAAGFKGLPYRDGHYPGIFKGAYKSLVTDAKGHVQGVIAVDSVYQRNAAKKWFAENHKDYTIIDQDRKGLADYKSQSDIFSGMNDVLQLLAENDPRFAEVQALVGEAIKHGNNSLFAFNRHELSKKGVLGNEGNKPWQDATKNAEAAHKALVQYMEEGALHHELQTPLKDLKELSIDPELAPLIPNTMKYLDGYVKHVTGQNIGAIGRGVDMALDLAPKLLGFGPRVPLQIAGTIKNRMSQKFMGFGNWAFMAAQLIQPAQTGLPFMQLAASRLGNHLDVPRSMMKGGTQFLLAGLEDMTGKKVDGLAAHQREAYQYAKERGLLNFSEMEKAYEGSQTKVGRAVDKVAEINMKVGEVGTRTPMFMSFVELMHEAGIPMKEALPMAENLTNLSMIDYHQWERPQMYQKMGTIGQFAGGLTTFKHGFIGQQAVLGKEIRRTGNPLPIAMSVAAMIALAGIQGMPGYDELNNAYGSVTNQFFGGRRNIRDDVLKNLPEWAKSGAIANATNVGIGSKFSSSNMVPDTIGKALSPQIENAVQIVANAIDAFKNNGDAQSMRNLIQSAVPASAAGIAESKVARDPENYVIGKDGKRVIYRSPEDWKLREVTGMRPQTEVNAREQLYTQKQKILADAEKVKENGKKAERMEINKTLTPAELRKLEDDNIKRGANPGSLIQRMGQASLDAKKTEKQRLEGTPTGNYSGIRKFQSVNPVNKPGER